MSGGFLLPRHGEWPDKRMTRPRAKGTRPGHVGKDQAPVPAADSARVQSALEAINQALRQARAALLAFDDPAMELALQRATRRAEADLPAGHARRARTVAEAAVERLHAEFVSMRPGFDEAAVAAAAALPNAGHEDLLARVLALRCFASGRDDNIERQIATGRQAMMLAPADAFVGMYVHMALAGSLHWIGDFASTAAHFRPALMHARALAEPLLEAFALRNMAVAEVKESRHAIEAGHGSVHMAAQAEASLRGCIDFYLTRTSRRRLSYPWLCVAEALWLQDRYDAALALYDEHLPIAVSEGLLLQAAEAGSRRARCLLALERTDEALAASDQAVQWLKGYDDPDVTVTVQCDRALVLAALGRQGEAEQSRALAAAARATLTGLSDRWRLPLLQALDGLS
jgi:tetratricopeptide (TPR) repeat protein